MKKKDKLTVALVKELELRKSEFENQTVETIYFGGGTPSLLTLEELQLLIDSINKNYNVSDSPEITLEANPDDIIQSELSPRSLLRSKYILNDNTLHSKKRGLFEGYKSIGINRLSIGIQSFFEDDLKQMNRAHSAEEARKCLEEATRHFDNITIDLIYGIPNMSLEKWDVNLQTAFGFGVNHISCYALTVEPKTALETFIKKGIYPPMDEDLAQAHFNHLVNETEKQGFVHYEISNFGKPEYFSKHNTRYWQGKPYLGIGPSAHSFVNNERSWNVSNNSKYIQAIEKNRLPKTTETLSVQDQYNEYVMTGLRTIWGVSINKVEKDFGEDYKVYLLDTSKIFINQKLLVVEEESTQSLIKTTQKGKFLVDGIASELFMI